VCCVIKKPFFPVHELEKRLFLRRIPSTRRFEAMFKKIILSISLFLWLPIFAHAATVQLPQTGQITCYNAVGGIISCNGTRQDGEMQKGVAWPSTRFTDNADGTVTDTLTGLIWLSTANCIEDAGGISKAAGSVAWSDALTWTNSLADGICSLSDASTPGDWRLPNIDELWSLVDMLQSGPALPSGHPFTDAQASSYWSSSTYAINTSFAWDLNLLNGSVGFGGKTVNFFVWPVRGGL
jgi:hypothetical protein